MRHYNVGIFGVLFLLLTMSCGRSGDTKKPADRTTTINSTTDLIIGAEDQPLEHQLGRPIAVRTDSIGNIYIADKASLEIKVFSKNGVYLRSLGGRGRGPGEFHDINLMEFTERNNFVILDRRLLQFVYITKEGEYLSSHPVDISGQLTQYYPASISFAGSRNIGLFLNGAVPDRSPMFERNLFHVYENDFQQQKYALFPFKELGMSDRFAWVNFVYYPGSFSISKDRTRMIYSPGIYTGKLFMFTKDMDGRWIYNRTITGKVPPEKPYIVYESESAFEMNKHLPLTRQLYFSGGPYLGRINYLDAGIHFLDNHQFVQFYADWIEPEKQDLERTENQITLFAQVFSQNGEVIESGYVATLTIDRYYLPQTLVNWRDHNGSFYLLEPGGGNQVPTIRRFSIDILE
ncbi:MAG: 6-bladed beta-propeller [Bacteroidetes bacterium]|nr:6-bladed beta-propeller [Bacteroidota bacterium]